MNKVINIKQAINLIPSESTVLISGSGDGVPVACLQALSDRFLSAGTPRDLTMISTGPLGDNEGTGFNIIAYPGLLKRVISSDFKNCPRILQLALARQVEVYTLPQDILSTLIQDIASIRTGLSVSEGAHKHINTRCHDNVRLFFHSLPMNVAIIRGSAGDNLGNVIVENESYDGEMFSIAKAVHHRGGIVVAQVKRLTATSLLNPKAVQIPAGLVNYVVVDDSEEQAFLPELNSESSLKPVDIFSPLPMDIGKVIVRRAAMELFPEAVITLGNGIPLEIANVAVEERIYDKLTLTTEQYDTDEIPMIDSSGSSYYKNDSVFKMGFWLDMYDGSQLDIAFFPFGEVDATGSVNVIRNTHAAIDPFWFMHIVYRTRKVVFLGTLTTGDLAIRPDNEFGLVLESEGTIHKWVRQLKEPTFNSSFALERGKDVIYITDRAVFRLIRGGLELTEIAPSVDIGRDVLGQIEFPIRVSPKLRLMDARLFLSEPMGILPEFLLRKKL
ncbi:MAG: CoA-transferase [Dehalobacterium sp.]